MVPGHRTQTRVAILAAFSIRSLAPFAIDLFWCTGWSRFVEFLAKSKTEVRHRAEHGKTFLSFSIHVWTNFVSFALVQASLSGSVKKMMDPVDAAVTIKWTKRDNCWYCDRTASRGCGEVSGSTRKYVSLYSRWAILKMQHDSTRFSRCACYHSSRFSFVSGNLSLGWLTKFDNNKKKLAAHLTAVGASMAIGLGHPRHSKPSDKQTWGGGKLSGWSLPDLCQTVSLVYVSSNLAIARRISMAMSQL